jgi:hypothetical protein
MDQTLVQTEPRRLSILSNSNVLTGLALLIVFAAALVSLRQLRPPQAVAAGASSFEFSSGRALKHIEAIATKPRPPGSLAHAATRDYLVQELSVLGLTPEIQKVSGVNRKVGTTIVAATVENVIARLKGTAGSKAVMLVGHYDSVPTGPGASDDASAVAGLLETARALKTQPPLRNDVIFLFTDGEEIGLLGAKAFVDEHPWAKDVGLVLNFEARGNNGPSMVFETSSNNYPLIREFAAAAPYPMGSSLSTEIYKRMPNDTDFTIFKAKGFAGLNFAYFDGFSRYHTRLDNLRELDERSLQHHGSYALALTRYFGSQDLENIQGNAMGARTDAVYFNVLGSLFLQYSGRWVVPLMLLSVLLSAAVIYLGFKNKYLTLTGSALGFLLFLGSLVLTPLLLRVVWWLVNAVQRSLGMNEQAAAYHQNLYILSLVALTIAVCSALYVVLAKRLSLANTATGAVLWWIVSTILTGLFLPGASYLFVWPLLFSLLALGFLFSAKTGTPMKAGSLAAITLSGLPGIILWTPMIYLLVTALGFGAAAMVIVMSVLLIGLFIPHLRILTSGRRWLLPGVTALTGISLLLAASFVSGFDDEHPRSENIFYALNADTNKAIWGSTDSDQDAWTRRLLSSEAEQSATTEYMPPQFSPIHSSVSTALPLAPPQVELLSDASNNGVRSLKLRITSPRQAPVVTVFMDAATTVESATVNGKRADGSGIAPRGSGQAWRTNYYALPPEGIELNLEIKSATPVKIHVMDQSYGLPEIPGVTDAARPSWVMPAAWRLYSDQTLVSRSFTF